MLEIAQKLERLDDLYTARESLHAEKSELLADVFSPEQLLRLDEIEAEYSQKEEAANSAIGELENEIKVDTLAFGETVKGSNFLAVWNKGRVTWDSNGLSSYAETHPEVLSYRKEGKPSVSIRRVQSKDLE